MNMNEQNHTGPESQARRQSDRPPSGAERKSSHEFRDMAKETLQHASQQVEKANSLLWFLDLDFKQFIATRLIRAIWFVYLMMTGILMVSGVLYFLWVDPALKAIVESAFVVSFLAILAIFARVALEVFAVLFRIADRLERLED